MASAGHAAPTDSVSLKLTGTVEARCALDIPNDNTDIALGEVSAGALDKTAELTFTIDCNAPFAYSLESTNGALANTTTTIGQGSDDFDTTLDYEVQFKTALEDGDTASIDQTCTSASIDDDLAAGSADQCDFEDSGTSIAIDEQGSLTISVDAEGKLLLAGAYTDELKLTVGVRP